MSEGGVGVGGWGWGGGGGVGGGAGGGGGGGEAITTGVLTDGGLVIKFVRKDD